MVLDAGMVVTIVLSMFCGAISSAVLVGSIKADLINMRDTIKEVSRKQDAHIDFHMKK